MPKHKRYAQALNLNDSWLEKKFDQGGITFRFCRYFRTTEGGHFSTPVFRKHTRQVSDAFLFFSFSFFFASLELQTHDVECLECAKRLSKRLSIPASRTLFLPVLSVRSMCLYMCEIHWCQTQTPLCVLVSGRSPETMAPGHALVSNGIQTYQSSIVVCIHISSPHFVCCSIPHPPTPFTPTYTNTHADK